MDLSNEVTSISSVLGSETIRLYSQEVVRRPEVRDRLRMTSRELTFILGLIFGIGSGCSHTPLSSYVSTEEGSPPPILNPKYVSKVIELPGSGTELQSHWSPDGNWIVFQHKDPEPSSCGQIYRIKKDGSRTERLFFGAGEAAHPVHLHGVDRILYSSTEIYRATCPPEKLDRAFQFFGVKTDGTDPIPMEAASPRAYSSEAAVCNKTLAFVSTRSGSPALYRATLDRFGTLREIKQLTQTRENTDGDEDEEELDLGGVSFSPDCKKIAWHQGYADQAESEIWLGDLDSFPGNQGTPITRFKAKSVNPTFTPDGKHIVFSSNFGSTVNTARGKVTPPAPEVSNLYLINPDDKKQVTRLIPLTDLKASSFDWIGFPAFSPDGKSLAFSARRPADGSVSIFVGSWVGSCAKQ